MQFMLMVYRNEEHFATVPDALKSGLSEACDVWGEKLKQSGHLRDMNRLKAIATAATVRKSGNRVVVTDGPFAETKEVLAGYVILECADAAEALELARTFPALDAGLAVEVRAVLSGEEERHCWRPH